MTEMNFAAISLDSNYDCMLNHLNESFGFDMRFFLVSFHECESTNKKELYECRMKSHNANYANE